MVQEANGGERWERMWTRAWFAIGDEFANVCKRAIQQWRRLAEQEGRELESTILWWTWSDREVKSLPVSVLPAA